MSLNSRCGIGIVSLNYAPIIAVSPLSATGRVWIAHELRPVLSFSSRRQRG